MNIVKRGLMSKDKPPINYTLPLSHHFNLFSCCPKYWLAKIKALSRLLFLQKSAD